jgi:hypothetical protein
MARRTKWVKPPDISLHHQIRNLIKTSCRDYNGKDFHTTMSTIYFLLHGTDKAIVDAEISKWVDVDELKEETSIVLPERFFK